MSNWLAALPSQAFAVILQIPWIVTLLFSAAAVRKDSYGRWGKEFILVYLGLYLFFWQFVLYIFQITLNMPREDPFHPGMIYYGYPSEVGFYTAVFVTFIVEFTLVWNVRLSVMYWMCLIVFCAAPCLVLVWFTFNTWQEVLLSMGVGVIVTSVYVIVARLYFFYHMPILLNSAPSTWLGCVDTWIQTTPEQHAETEYVRECFTSIDRLLQQAHDLGQPLPALR
jgi:hypothetical protein